LEYNTLKLNIYPNNAIVEKTFPNSKVLGSEKAKIIADRRTPELKYIALHIYLILTYLPKTFISSVRIS
jgi:hypothetical protein